MDRCPSNEAPLGVYVSRTKKPGINMVVTNVHTEPCDVSICIVNWNGREVLADLLESLHKLTDAASIEVIVVDNASADGSVEMVQSLFPWVKLIVNGRNVGFAGANNQAARVASGRRLYFLNNDTILPGGSTDTLVRFLDEHPEASAVGPQLLNLDGSHQPSCRNLPTLAALLHQVTLLRWMGLFRSACRRYRRVKLQPDQIAEVPQLGGAALLVRREAFDTCGGWDDGFVFGLEDVDLCARLRTNGPLFYMGKARVTHLGGVGSKANSRFVYRSYKCGYARYLRKHHPKRWAAPLYKLLVTVDLPFVILDDAVTAIASAFVRKTDRTSNRLKHMVAAASFLCCDLRRFWLS
ncbi:MAG: glycosyltransferase [Terriglobia bacterium]